jgi:hypothetical protein
VPLGVVHPGPAQPLHRALQPRRRNVAGREAAPVPHGRRQGEGLAAGAGAVIRHPHPRPGAGEEGDELAALVLHLDQPFLEGVGGGDGPALRHAQPPRREGHRLRPDPLRRERRRGAVARRLQQVGAEVERRRRHHRSRFFAEARPEAGAEARQHPIRQLEPHRFRHPRVLQHPAGAAPSSDGAQRPFFRPVQRLGRVLAPGEGAQHGGEVEPLRQQQIDGDQQPRRGARVHQFQPPAEPQPAPQHAPHALRHRAAVAAADVAPGAEEIVGDGIGGAAAGRFDRVQQVDGGGEAGGGRHAASNGGRAPRPGSTVASSSSQYSTGPPARFTQNTRKPKRAAP